LPVAAAAAAARVLNFQKTMHKGRETENAYLRRSLKLEEGI